jgi:Flp pilus assembly secretin CpaC
LSLSRDRSYDPAARDGIPKVSDKEGGSMALSRSLATLAAVTLLSFTSVTRAQKNPLKNASSVKAEPQQIMIQAVLAEVQDLDDEILKAACQRVNAEGIQAIEPGKSERQPAIYSMSSDQAGRLLAVIEKRRPTQVLSRPSVLAMDGQVAEIMVGKKVKNPATSRAGVNEQDREWKNQAVGLAVSLTPSIQEKKRTRLNLTIDDSYLAGDPFEIFVEKKDGKTVASPIVNRTRLQTTLETADGKTVLVAVRSKKPADETEPKKTTLVLLTPKVVERTAAAGEILHH